MLQQIFKLRYLRNQSIYDFENQFYSFATSVYVCLHNPPAVKWAMQNLLKQIMHDEKNHKMRA